MSDQTAPQADSHEQAALALKEAVAKHRAAAGNPINPGSAPQHGLFTILANPAVVAFVENTAVDVLGKALALFQQYVQNSSAGQPDAAGAAEAAPTAEVAREQPQAAIHLPGAP